VTPIRIADLGRIITGATPPTKEPHLFGSELPFITPSDMTFDRKHVQTVRGISAAGAARFKTRLLPPNAVAVVCIGATIGKVCMTDATALTNQQVNSIVVDKSQHSPDFVYYLMRTMKDRLKAVAGGAATPIVNKGSFGALEVTVPDQETQVRIGAHLRSFDDLIGVNLRRIEILEEMARSLFREWFVRFRFPGHQEVDLVDSDLGPIPAGWEQTCLARELKLRRCNIRPFEYAEEVFDHYSIPAFDDRRLPIRESGNEIKSTKYLLSGESVLMSKLNTRIPRVWRVDRSDLKRRAVASTEFLVLTEPFRWTPLYVYGLATSNGFASRLVSLSGGTSTSHQRVKPADVMSMVVVSPPVEIVQRYTDVVKASLKLADNLLQQSEVLSEARDLLLFRLVSGELYTSEIEMDLEVAGV